MVLLADTREPTNQVLAKGLKVKRLPTIQLYRSMAAVASLVQPTAQQLREAVAAATAGASSKAATAAIPSPAGPEERPSHPAGAGVDGRCAQPAAGEAAGKQAGGTPAKDLANAAQQVDYNPPCKGGKNVRRKFQGGIAEYYPKMPCLQCGCPWWLGDDWDAQCVRCQWDCEQDGYDDDSKPLPAFKATWLKFTQAIAAGSTPEWPPAVDPA